MSIVTFWNADREQSGVSISTVAVATKMAIERNLKVLIVSAAYNDSTIKNCFWKENAVRKQIMADRSSSIAIENGVEGLSRLIASNKIEPENITDYTHVIFKDTLEVLDGYMENPTKTKEENLRDYKTISAVYPAILNVANQYYDMVLVDLSRELDEGVRNEILKIATINLYIAGQKLRSLDYYIQLKMDNPIVAEPKNIIVIGKYSHYSKYNKSNLQKYLREKKEFSYSTICKNFYLIWCSRKEFHFLFFWDIVNALNILYQEYKYPKALYYISLRHLRHNWLSLLFLHLRAMFD